MRAAPRPGTAAKGTGTAGARSGAGAAAATGAPRRQPGARGQTHLQTGSPSPPCTFGSQRQYPSESSLVLNTSP